MAKFFFNWSTYSTGPVNLAALVQEDDSPLCQLYTPYTASSTTVLGQGVELSTDGIGGKALRYSNSEGGTFSLKVTMSTAIPTTAPVSTGYSFGGQTSRDWDVVALFRISSGSATTFDKETGVALKCWVDDTYDGVNDGQDEYVYQPQLWSRYSASGMQLGRERRINASAGFWDASSPPDTQPTLPIGQSKVPGAWYYMRMQVDGSTGGNDRIRGRVWQKGTAESTVWVMNEVTNTNLSSSIGSLGGVGFVLEPSLPAGRTNLFAGMAASDNLADPVTVEQLMAGSTATGPAPGGASLAFSGLLSWST